MVVNASRQLESTALCRDNLVTVILGHTHIFLPRISHGCQSPIAVQTLSHVPRQASLSSSPLIPRVCLSSCSLSQWHCLTISSSVTPFSFCLQSFPPSGSFPMSQLLASFLPKKSQGWSPSEWTGWISLQSNRLSRVSPTPQFESINSSVLSLLYGPTLTSVHDFWKNHSFDYTDLCQQSDVFAF